MNGSPMPVRISYIFEYADYQTLLGAVAADPRMRRHNSKWQWVVWGGSSAALLAILIVIDILWPRLPWFEPSSAMVGFVAYFNMFVILANMTKQAQQKSLFTMSRNAGKSVTYELSDDGIAFEVARTQGVAGWPDIVRSVAGADHFLLFISSLEAYVFPRRAFASDADFNAALAFAQEKVHGQTL